jgi:sugar O-acyltransferase (sialic acid O-acetyltransferase NeuD family)
MEPIAIFGAGGLGCLVHDILLQIGRFRIVAFLDSDRERHGREIDGLPVLGGMDIVSTLPCSGVEKIVVAIGDNHARVLVAETLRRAGLQLASAIHPLASISPTALLGEHLIIGPRVTVCVHARIGAHCVLSAGAIVEHDNELGTGVFLHPAVRLAGTVKIEDGATVCIGASIIPGRRIGRWSRVEPGSVVIRDVPPDTIVGGAPATVRVSRQRSRNMAVAPV